MLKTDTTCFITPARRGMAVGIARDEPSHIHIPRPSRSVRPYERRTTTAEQQARSEADLLLAGNAR